MSRSAANHAQSSYNVAEDLEEQYLPDFEKLSNASLQKYRMFFNIECSEEELAAKVKDHFRNSLEINQNQLYERVFKLKREEREEIKNRKTLRIKKENPKQNF